MDKEIRKRIILASGSPRRLEILRKHGIEPVVMPTKADETLPDEIDMTAAVEYLASVKAGACYDVIKNDPAYAGCIVLGADTIVYKGEIMGKPEDHDDAFRMLDMIRGTSHYVVTGVCLIDTDRGDKTVLSDITTVWCRNYTDEEIEDYISLTEPYDKAGSYAIQGEFGKHIDHIDGDYENVVGLPFHRIEKLLAPYI